MYTVRETCRICDGRALEDVVSLGMQYVSGFTSNGDHGVQAPLDLMLCTQCGLVQLRHSVDPDLLYRQYWYKSGVNQSMRTELQDIVDQAGGLVCLTVGDTVVDIGCNDGTLLSNYDTFVHRIGFEPATNLCTEAGRYADVVVNDYFSACLAETVLNGRTAKVITSIAMFYDLEDPNAFVADVERVLAEDGIWIIQMAYLPSMLSQNAFDNICHEHLEYYSLATLVQLLGRHGLSVFDAELNDTNGGSIRVFVSKRGNAPRVRNRAIARLEWENGEGLGEPRVYDHFRTRVNTIRHWTQEIVRSSPRVYGYGASTKGNTLLQYFGLDHTVIHAIADRNPAKWGLRTVGTNIPIVSEDEARAQNPSHFFVLPWHFMREFEEREADFLNAGGKFIVPLPRFRVVGR